MDDKVSQSYYWTLLIPKDATPAQITRAYRHRVISCHLEKVRGESAVKLRFQRFLRILEAYHVLSDNYRRQRYDGWITLTRLRAKSTEALNSYEFASSKKGFTAKVEIRDPRYETKEPAASRKDEPDLSGARCTGYASAPRMKLIDDVLWNARETCQSLGSYDQASGQFKAPGPSHKTSDSSYFPSHTPNQQYPDGSNYTHGYQDIKPPPIDTGYSSSGHPIKSISSDGSSDSSYKMERASMASKERRLSPPPPSSLREYPCLFPNCGHISLRAHDITLHVMIHFPPPVDELLDCPYEWCGRTGAFGFKREDQRKEHYRKVHMKPSEYPKTGKGGRSGRNIWERTDVSAPPETYIPVVSENEKNPVQTKATDGEGTVREHTVPPSGNSQTSRLGSDQSPSVYETPPDQETVGSKISVPDSELVMADALYADSIMPMDWTPLRPDELDMVPSEAIEPSFASPKESVREPSEDSILDGFRAPVERKNRILPETTALNGDETLTFSMCNHEIQAVIRDQVLKTVAVDQFGRYSASLQIDWGIVAFMEHQFPDHDFSNTMLGPVVTISGSVQHAQATTCLEYIRQNWPAHGSRVLDGLQDALNSPTRTSRSNLVTCSDDGSASCDVAPSSFAELEFDVTQGKVCLNIESGTPDVIGDIVQQLVWMGAALRTSADGLVQYCEPKIAEVSKAKGGEPMILNITFDMSSPDKEDQSCWLSLFANPVIARGFPVPKRENGERGLEVPLEIMAALGGARHLTDFEGGLILKGHSAMFVPVKRLHQSIQWHLIRCSDDHRILYREVRNECPNRTLLEEVDHESLRNTRAFLGWWKSAETHLGTADAAYTSIDWSPACEAKRPTRYSGGNIGFSHVFTGQLSFAPGVKDGRLHLSQKGPFQRIVQCAANTPVVLYDQADRRAWFVPGLDLMLHIVQTRHHIAPYKVDGRTVELTPVNPENGRGAAMEAVAANQSRQLYERDVVAEKSYYFKHAILDIWSQMERLMEKEDSIKVCTGLALNGTMQEKVHGWEYMSLVHERNYRQKEATVAKSSGGWVDLINDIDVLVLFATGLDELIRPVSDLSNLCQSWKTLPKEKDFLAAGVPMLEQLYSEAGSRLSRKHLSISHLQLHRGCTLFEECSDMASDRCGCDRTQQIYHNSLFKTFGHVRSPGSLEGNGCVIIGQSHHSFRPRKVPAIRQNAVHMPPNTPIQNGGTLRQSPIKDDCLLSPSHPAAIWIEPDEVNGSAVQDWKRTPSPPRFTEDLMRDKTVALKRRRKMSRIQLSESKFYEGRDSCNGETSLSEDYATCSIEYEPVFKGDTTFKTQGESSTQTVCASDDEYDHVYARKAVRRKAKSRNYSHPYGCACTTCIAVDFEPPGSIELVNISTGTRRNSTNMAERRGRQPV